MKESECSDREGSVSVIIPAYNSGSYIREAIHSVLVQGPAVREVIVIDDGSSDGTPTVAKGLDSRVRIIEQENAGPAAARNSGLKAAKGDYIAFLDADDVWLPGKVEAQLAHIAAHPEHQVVFGRILYWDPEAPSVELLGISAVEHTLDFSVSGWIYPELLLDSVVCIITVLMHRSVYETVGKFDESLPTGEDYDYWLRVSRSFQMVKLSRYMARYRLHGQSTTRTPRSESNELKVLLRAVESFGLTGPDGRTVSEEAIRKRIGQLWFDHGHLHYWHGDRGVARDAFTNALRYRADLKTYAYRVFSAIRASQLGRSSARTIERRFR